MVFAKLAAAGLLSPILITLGTSPALQPHLQTCGAETKPTPSPAISTQQLQIIVHGQKNTLSLPDLKALPHKTVRYHNTHVNADESYSGVPLIDLLARYGATTGARLHGKPLADYLVATGSDGYRVVLSLVETDPTYQSGDVLIADARDGKPLDAANGPFKLIVTQDKRSARFVEILVSIDLRSAE